ncbi:protease inhibitors-like [Photinus pyralis]|uniref:protease inhibitors-like n=1 Tax=Photinus pyralis TaxID=7054 RepID=UPI001266FB07|nr:protease inhibitors-like [Photinus pyralis]
MKLTLFVILTIFVFCYGENFVCREGVSYLANDCSDCVCAPNGNFGCTLKACVVPGEKQKKYDCKEGSTFMKECNKCWCVKNGGLICENEDCK